VISAQIFQENTFLETKLNFTLTRKCFSLTRGDRFRFGFLGQKPVQTGLTRFFSWFSQFWLGFSGFGLVFFSVSVRFGFFGFLLVKPNRPVFSKF